MWRLYNQIHDNCQCVRTQFCVLGRHLVCPVNTLQWRTDTTYVVLWSKTAEGVFVVEYFSICVRRGMTKMAWYQSQLHTIVTDRYGNYPETWSMLENLRIICPLKTGRGLLNILCCNLSRGYATLLLLYILCIANGPQRCYVAILWRRLSFCR